MFIFLQLTHSLGNRSGTGLTWIYQNCDVEEEYTWGNVCFFNRCKEKTVECKVVLWSDRHSIYVFKWVKLKGNW